MTSYQDVTSYQELAADGNANTTSTRRDTQMGCPPLWLRGTRDYGGLGVPDRSRGGIPVARDLLVVPLQLRRAIHSFQNDREGR